MTLRAPEEDRARSLAPGQSCYFLSATYGLCFCGDLGPAQADMCRCASALCTGRVLTFPVDAPDTVLATNDEILAMERELAQPTLMVLVTLADGKLERVKFINFQNAERKWKNTSCAL